jgi:hypothetical protein
MRAVLRATVIVLSAVAMIILAVGTIRGVKRHPVGAQFLAGAMLLVLGAVAPVPNPPQQGIEEAREDKGKKGSESGDPPTIGPR